MDLARDSHSFEPGADTRKVGVAPASSALTAEIVRELVTSPDASRATLAAALQESTRQFESLLSCVSGTFYRSELAVPWRMEFISHGIEAIAGHGPGFFAETPFGALIEPEDIPALERAIDEAVMRREHFTACYRIRHKSGETRWVSERGAAVFDAAGRPQFLEGFISDVTESKKLEMEAEQARIEVNRQADELRNTLDSIPVMVWTGDAAGAPDYYNKSWKGFIGNAAPRAWLHPEDRKRCFGEWRQSLDTGRPFQIEVRARRHSGEYRWLLARSWPRRNESGEIVKWCGVAIDIHERVTAEQNLRESRLLQTNIFDASNDCIQITDANGKLRYVNTQGLRAAGAADAAQFIGREWTEMWPEESRSAGRRAFRRALKGKITRLVESNPGPNGPKACWDIVVSPIRDTNGDVSRVLSIARDVTEQRVISERLRIASEQDVLTGLPNRRAFDKHLRKVTGRARDTGVNVGLMLLDLDHFKHVNDTLGHLAGDLLLKAVARRLKGCVKDIGFVARLGGDEFAIVLDQIEEEKELVAVATRVLARMEAPVMFSGKPINGGLSIGCAMYPRDASDAQSLLQHTDTALYDLKTSGRGGIQMFNSRMMEAAERTANQLHLARAAIRDDAVEPYYQPKVRLDDGSISGFEALLRWWSPGNGIQPPSSVAEAFNDYELSTRIGGLMQSRIFADMSAWLRQGLDLPPVSINAAPAEFLRDDYAERLLDRLCEYRLSPALIEVEITEHVFLERRSEQVVRALELLKKAGVRIALDDFGTGHSSLSHLRDFPVDVLKIDRSFVSRMLIKPRMLAIVQAITKLGPSLSLDIVAEGVETPEQLHTLRDAGCEFGQGYLFGKAMHAAEVGRRLATGVWPYKLRT